MLIDSNGSRARLLVIAVMLAPACCNGQSPSAQSAGVIANSVTEFSGERIGRRNRLDIWCGWCQSERSWSRWDASDRSYRCTGTSRLSASGIHHEHFCLRTTGHSEQSIRFQSRCADGAERESSTKRSPHLSGCHLSNTYVSAGEPGLPGCFNA